MSIFNYNEIGDKSKEIVRLRQISESKEKIYEIHKKLLKYEFCYHYVKGVALILS